MYFSTAKHASHALFTVLRTVKCSAISSATWAYGPWFSTAYCLAQQCYMGLRPMVQHCIVQCNTLGLRPSGHCNVQ